MTTTTSTKLYFLISIFIVGFLSLFSLNQIFIGLVNNLDQQTQNYKAKIQIGEYVAEDILKIKSLFFELATTTTSKRSRDIVEKKIDIIIQNINVSLNILEKGGVLKRFIELNIEGHTNTIKNIHYMPKAKNQLPLEVIDIRPKLIDLEIMIQEVNKLLTSRDLAKKAKNTNKFSKVAKKIRRFYKSTPAFFTRMSENIRRLLYEGDIELNTLKIKIKNKKNNYMKIKMTLIFSVIIIVLGLGYWITSIIKREEEELIVLNKDLKNKELAVKAILDGQDNMVIVSDGIKMIDANDAIADFFDEFTSLKDFMDKYDCICDLFQTDIPDNTYLIKKDYEGLNWLEYALANQDKHLKVIMSNGRENHHFSLAANKRRIDDEGHFIIIASLNDITSEIESQKNLKNLNDNLELIVETKMKELSDLNENLEQKILIETQKVIEKDKQMVQQARFAALGEMIGNIAHQWRQPLSAINTTASGMKLQMQLNLTNNQEIDESYNKIMGYVDFLTQTIEDFRGFFKEDKKKVDFNIIDTLKKTLSITNASYKDNNITLIDMCSADETLSSHGMPSELSQVFLNILSNAKDAIVNNDDDEKFVNIQCNTKNGYNIISIQDNGGGIPTDVIDKIFDPYFTTKHQSQGTGIGLYMSKDIIENHMQGIITVQNRSITLDDNNYYQGACFTIKLPVSQKS